MSRRRIVLLSSMLPLPIDRGDKNRLFHILKILSQFAEVHLVCLQRGWEQPVLDMSRLNGIVIHLIKISKQEVLKQGIKATLTGRPYIAFRYGAPRVMHMIREKLEILRPDVVWQFQISAFPFLKQVKDVKLVFDLVDSPSRYFQMARKMRNKSLRDRVLCRLQWRINNYEKSAISNADIVIVNSRQDMEHIINMHGASAKLRLLYNCVPGSLMNFKWHVNSAHPGRLLFVGNLAYPPNAEGVRYFARQILPRIQREMPKTEFVICGTGSARLTKSLADQPGVRFFGYVDDLIPFYLSASMLVVPVPLAGGTPYKLLEAMAIGLPVVATRAASEVSETKHGQELLVGDSSDGFASAVLSVLCDSELASRLSFQARSFVLAKHTWEDKAELLREIVGEDILQ